MNIHILARKKIQKIIKEGGLVFFLDGYDEIPFKDREKVTVDLKYFIDNYSNNTYAITSRPETGLSAFPSFKQYTIRPLKKEESFELIKKYDNNGTRSQQLIDRLKGRDFKSVMDFLKNPLLTTLLYRCYEYKQSLPLKKHVFYRQVFDALFDWHDATKDGYNTREKKSKLDIDSFHRVLRVMGMISVMKGEVEGDTDTVLTWIREARKICVGISFSESDFLDDLVRAVPVFIRDGTSYRWSHKSLAEYFAAQYICTEGKQTQDKVFCSMWDSKKLYRFSNMLDQIYDLDIQAFRKYFILPMSREFTAYWNNVYKSFLGQMSIEEINLRKSVCFGARYIIVTKLDKKIVDDFNIHVVSSMNSSLDKLTPDEVPFSVSVRRDAKDSKPQPVFIFSFQSPSLVILQILEAKKDFLVYSKPKLDLSNFKNFPTKKSIKKVAEVTDDINNELNSKRNFNAVTKQLIMNPFSVVVDHEKLLQFENTFQDEITVNSFADNLLISINGA